MTAYPLTPVRYRAFDKNGEPLIGGQVFAYEAGSTTNEKDTYSDKSMQNLNTWPVVLDDMGSASIYISGDYFFQVFDEHGSLIEEGDGIADAESIAQALIDGNSGGGNNLEQRVTDLETARDEHTDQINDLIDDTGQLRTDLNKEVETDRDAAIKAAVDSAKATLKEEFDLKLAGVAEVSKLPVGSIYLTLDATNPSDLLDYGTWTLVAQGKAIVGLSNSISDPAWTKILGGSYGSYDVALTADQNGKHNHGIGYSTNINGQGTIDGGSSGVTGTNQTDFSGEGDPHNNVQPSMVFAIWRRTT
ncbi:phage baseplate protein [Acinetobacter higginsii]|uniref:phage baseplate protein n=1 Tax=Acinetobacter higginsii TaxID=70347 RepID=UPI001F4B4950|nr:hypothetical protein [Acinetobacter higginsii]MCH7295477.1 hypothetical protein [Acinetobacter higginsii]